VTHLEAPSSPSQATKSSTTSPTLNNRIVPLTLADIKRIQDSCVTEKAKFLIQTGDASAKEKCFQACLNGMCCVTDGLWYAEEPCFAGNERKCSQYTACLILREPHAVQSDEKNVEIIEIAGNSTI
jgi:hypothetical protein